MIIRILRKISAGTAFPEEEVDLPEKTVSKKAQKRESAEMQEKKDMITLSGADLTFWSGMGYSNFHYRNCIKLKGLTHVYRFTRYSDVLQDGFRHSRLCTLSEKTDGLSAVCSK